MFSCPTTGQGPCTGYENGNINAVMDGDLDGFINAYLAMKAGQ
jgi:protein subunit release factor B